MALIIDRHFSDPVHSPRWSWKQFDGHIEAPEFWSENAVEIAASKYLRTRENECRLKDLFGRVVSAIAESARAQLYLESTSVFEEELLALLLGQIGSFNSPVYFNVGIFPRFRVAGRAENFVWDEGLRSVIPTATAYIRPQASACFIQDVQDDLLSIFDLLKSESKLFKFGSGTGTNFSRLRAKGEILDGGGESTGLISYLEIFDKAAQAIKSGGTTRRAAKMVVLDADHPEILQFIDWKMLEERKARVLLNAGYSSGMEGEAFRTVSGQNSNNSVRVTDAFLNAATNNEPWLLKPRRKDGVPQSMSAALLLKAMARAAWECADPGIQYHDTIQKWHMCPNSGPIRASNPCSEFMFLDNSACNLASLNLVRFLNNGQFDWTAFEKAAKLFLTAQDVLVDYASYPTAEIAQNSHDFRPLGLGFTNLGGVLMRLGVPYESEAAVGWTLRISAALHAWALEMSCALARQKGPFARWGENREPALKVVDQHVAAWQTVASADFAWLSKLYDRLPKEIARDGLRNAQVTLIAPTGTIGLLMDCDTLGIEPDFALRKRKTLAGGGEMSIVNQSVSYALRSLGYKESAIEKILKFVLQTGTVCGAPGFQEQHQSVFDCALPPPGHPGRRISAEGHLQIMAAAQPFLSGAISKTVNLPASTRVDDIETLYLRAWRLGLKSLAIYRDGSKALQPLCAEC